MAGKKLISDEIIVLDYSDHRNTRFERCKIIYRGGMPPTLVGNDFIGCEWIFENEAQNTIAFLRGLASGGGKRFVDEVLGLVKNGN